MTCNINKWQNTPEGIAYLEKLTTAKLSLAGATYCKEVQTLVPGYSVHAIHNIINGRGKNDLVLQAFLIVVGKRAKKADSERLRLEKIAARAGLVG